jgi:thioesterase domain-containing protein
LGYAGDPDLTAKRFLPDPFAEDGARVYRSGDRARWRADGTIEFLGRTDRQLKVRGFRIEPREVEEALRSHPAVADVFVTGHERPGRDRALAAYVVAAAGAAASDAELRAHAARQLPAYAVPAGWCRLERLPLGTSGKLDVAGLPAPAYGASRSGGALGRRQLDPLERRLTEIWERALDLDGINPDDDFFAIGGHSLLAIEVFDAIERSLGQRLPLAMIFEAPTVRLLAAMLRVGAAPETPGSLVTLTPTGDRPPLFVVSAGDGNSVGFGALARRLGPDQPFFVLQPRGLNGGAPLHTTVEGMARHFLRAIRRVRPQGPYLLGGRCAGAPVAYEMARRLAARGEDVPLLVVLDSLGPRWEPRHLADGTPFDEHINRALRRPEAELELDPFSPEGGQRLVSWLLEPCVTGADGTPVNRYLYEFYRSRSDVRDAFPDLPGRDARAYVDWACANRLNHALLARFMPRLEGRVQRAIFPLRRAHGRAITARTRVALHAAEVADLALGDRRRGGAASRRERVLQAAVVALGAYRAGPYSGAITLIRSEEWTTQIDRWHGLDTAGVVERDVPGTHRSMMREPDVAGFGACLTELIDEIIDGGHVPVL